MPQVYAEIAFAKDATDSSPLWRDVSADVEWWKGVSIARRRSHELDEVQPGTLSLSLSNTDGRYTAGNTSSIHYPNIKINRPIRVRARWPVSVNLLAVGQAAGSDASLFGLASGWTSAVDTAVFPAGQTSSIRFDTGVLAATGIRIRIGSSQITTATDQGIPVVAGSSYTLSCQVRRDASLAVSFNARVRWYDGAGTLISESSGTTLALTTSFQALTCAATAPAGAVWARANLANMTTTAGSVAVYVGALQFEQAAAASTWVSPGVDYPLYSGFVDKWPHAWTNGVLGYVSVTATDRQKLLSRQILGATVLTTSVLSGTRVTALLTAAGVTTMSVDAGVSTLGLSGNEATQNLQSLLRSSASSEAGLFFIGKDGTPNFQDRSRRQRPSTAVVTLTADQVGPDLMFLVDDALLINDATVLGTAASTATSTDSASIASYGQYSKRLDTVLVSAEVADRAAYLLFRYKEPAPRASQISLEVSSQSALMDEMLGAEIGQRIQVTSLPSNAPSGTLDLWVEGVSHAITDQSWTTTFDPSPASTTISFILDDPVYGLLDSNVLGW